MFPSPTYQSEAGIISKRELKFYLRFTLSLVETVWMGLGEEELVVEQVTVVWALSLEATMLSLVLLVVSSRCTPLPRPAPLPPHTRPGGGSEGRKHSLDAHRRTQIYSQKTIRTHAQRYIHYLLIW